MKASAQRSTKKMLNKPQKRALHKLWARCYKDCSLFQQTGVGIKQGEIDQLLKLGLTDEIETNDGLYEKLAQSTAIVPIDPTKLLCISNAVLVSPKTRALLMKQWKRLGPEEYSNSLTRELSYLSMNAIDRGVCEVRSQGEPDSTGSDFNYPLCDTTAMALEEHAPVRNFLETDSVMVSLEEHTLDVSFVGADRYMSEQF